MKTSRVIILVIVMFVIGWAACVPAVESVAPTKPACPLQGVGSVLHGAGQSTLDLALAFPRLGFTICQGLGTMVSQAGEIVVRATSEAFKTTGQTVTDAAESTGKLLSPGAKKVNVEKSGESKSLSVGAKDVKSEKSVEKEK